MYVISVIRIELIEVYIKKDNKAKASSRIDFVSICT